jgi:hypothetical protein
LEHLKAMMMNLTMQALRIGWAFAAAVQTKMTTKQVRLGQQMKWEMMQTKRIEEASLAHESILAPT